MATIVVRAQARGGKFLGKAVSATPPKLQVFQGKTPIPDNQIQQFITANSGKVVQYPDAITTEFPIAVADNPNPDLYIPRTNYLQPAMTPSLGDSYATVELDLGAERADYTFTVTAYDTDTGSTVQSSVSMALAIDTQLPPTGIVVPLDGLRITDASATPTPNGVVVTADVAMMCGCQITPVSPAGAPPAEPYWPASEFSVSVTTPNGDAYPMTCDAAFSVFTTPGPIPFVSSGAALTIKAVQLSYGLNNNLVTVTVP